MNIDIFVIIIGITTLFVGAFLGAQFFKVYTKRQNKKILKNAEEVLSGKRENKIKIDGEEFDANRFIIKDKDNNETIVDLQGGGIEQNGTREKSSTRAEEIPNQDVEVDGKVDSGSREISRGRRKEKRPTRVRSITPRIRRFG